MAALLPGSTSVPYERAVSCTIAIYSTGLLTHKLNFSISDECPLLPLSVQKMNALIVISATQKSREARGQKSDSGSPKLHFLCDAPLGHISGRQRPRSPTHD